jgi:hypothetical protein
MINGLNFQLNYRGHKMFVSIYTYVFAAMLDEPVPVDDTGTISWIFRKVATRFLILLSYSYLPFLSLVEADDSSPNGIRISPGSRRPCLDLAYDVEPDIPDQLRVTLSKNPRLFLLPIQVYIICQANTRSPALDLLLRQCRRSLLLLRESEAGNWPSLNSVYRRLL